MIKEIRDFIGQFEQIDLQEKINVEFLPDEAIAYSLVEVPLQDVGKGVGVVKLYGNGYKVKEFRVDLQRITNYAEPTKVNIANSNFMKDFESWLEQQSKLKNFPNISGMLEMNITTSGYLQAVSEDGNTAVYTVSLQFIYMKKEN